MSQPISNPGSAFGYTSLEQTSSRRVMEVKTTVALSKGDVVAWVSQNTDVAPTVLAAIAGTTDPAVVCGVALNAAAANGTVLICRDGPCLVNISTGTVAHGERAILLSGATGFADGVAADATTIEGDTFGVFLGGEIGSTNQAVLDVRL